MAKPVVFTGTNITMVAPEGADDVQDVRAFRNERFCVTCWQLSPSELAEVLRTGNVWLSVMGNGGMPPCFVGGEEETRGVVADGGDPLPAQEPLHAN